MRCIRLALGGLLAALLVGCSSLPPEAPLPPAPAAIMEDYQAALADMEAGRSEAARETLQGLTRQHPDLAGPFANLGLLYQQGGDTAQAAAAFDRALALQPQSSDIYNSAGVFYRSVGRFADAEAAYLQAMEHDPALAAPVLNLAILYDLYLHRPRQALVYYRQYLELGGDDDGRVAMWLMDLQRREE